MDFFNRFFPEEWSRGVYPRMLLIGFIAYEAVTAPIVVYAGYEPTINLLLNILLVAPLARHLIFFGEVIFALIALGIYLWFWLYYFGSQKDRTIRLHHKWAMALGFVGLVAPTYYLYWHEWHGEGQLADALGLLFPTMLFGMVVGTGFGFLLERLSRPFDSKSIRAITFNIGIALTVLAVALVVYFVWWYYLDLWEATREAGRKSILRGQ